MNTLHTKIQISRRAWRRGLAFWLALLLVLAQASFILAAPDNGYEIAWWTVDGGGGMNSLAGSYVLSDTSGQPDASPVQSGGSYELIGGFWGITLSPQPSELPYKVNLPVVIRP